MFLIKLLDLVTQISSRSKNLSKKFLKSGCWTWLVWRFHSMFLIKLLDLITQINSWSKNLSKKFLKSGCWTWFLLEIT